MENQRYRQGCQLDIQNIQDYRAKIPSIVDALLLSCGTKECFDHIESEPIPLKNSIIEIIHKLQGVLFPGYFVSERLDKTNLRYYLGQEANSIFDELSLQITLCIRHECIRHNLPCTHCEERGLNETIAFMKELPNLRLKLAKDVRAAIEGDPAATSEDEIIFSYPGLFALTVYRIAHQLRKQGISLMPRIMTEYAHGVTGIDIHPGAEIGESFFIDHGVGVVIGETTEIGNRVRIYQGVTLGALALPKDAVPGLRGKKRHPTVENDVIIYAGATILGGDTVIGARSIIGGNVWITKSVPPDHSVYIKSSQLMLKNAPVKTSNVG